MAKKASAKSKKTAAKKAPIKKPAKSRKNAGQFKKGQSGNPAGKKPGTKNKFTKALVDLVFSIEKDLAAKKKGLKDCAAQDPKWFYEKFLAKLLPKPVDVSTDIEGEIIIKWQE